MSYVKVQDIAPTIGTGPRGYVNYLNPMLPQPMYSLRAAGPAFLSGVDGYVQHLRSSPPIGLRGLGADMGDLLGGGVKSAVRAVIDEAWPILNEKMQESLRPMMIVGGVTMVAALAGVGLQVMRMRERR